MDKSDKLIPGIYEQVLSEGLKEKLDSIEMIPTLAPIDLEEANDVFARYLGSLLRKYLKQGREKGESIEARVEFVNTLIALFSSVFQEDKDVEKAKIDKSAQQLLALIEKHDPIYVFEKKEIVRPITSIASSSLFTGSKQEPDLVSEFKKEIKTSDRIDILVSFIKWSGLRLIMTELKDFTENGGQLRVISTSYMGATDLKAIEELYKLANTKIHISYDTKRTRLHAKVYVFHRNNGFTTVYIGSSNLSNIAISSGLEWNMKISAQDQPDVLKKVEASFESYLESKEFEEYKETYRDKLSEALKRERSGEFIIINKNFPFTIMPYPYQQEILDRLDAERKIHKSYKNLVVAATGTGKTVVAAFDYKRYKEENHSKPCKLLFIAHRKEILEQSLDCFRAVLKNPNFGELMVGEYTASSIEHLFISVQSINSKDFLESVSKTYYDYIIIDEFHHAAAPTYKKILEYFEPEIMLGLTATPERMDGKDVVEFFDGRVAAEIRLTEAIERKLLCPFHYFGISDDIDLSNVTWTKGGYQTSELENVFVISRYSAQKRGELIIQAIENYITDLNEIKGLGFCVSIMHAEFMADFFNSHGIPSLSLTGGSIIEERNSAKERLIRGEIKFIFVVDIYNEGVDIPEVNTVLFLRPTESLTVFIQQLGRGLRLSKNKECLTVLDFIGQAHKKFSFEARFKALLARSQKSVKKEILDGFVTIPKGCFIELEKLAQEYVLKNIDDAIKTRLWFIKEISSFEADTGLQLSFTNFLKHYQIEPAALLNRGSFSRLCVDAKVKANFIEELEELITKAFPRIAWIDSRRWLSFLIRVLPIIEMISFNEEEERMLEMFFFTIWQKRFNETRYINLKDGFIELKQNKVMFAELMEILQYNYDHIDFVDKANGLPYICPLDVHCTYSRDQILVALGFYQPANIREGVKYLQDLKTDVFFITLNKSDKEYSPSTMYDDYSISEDLFHWQSQSTTSADSPTGERYINHKALGSRVLLFVRESKRDSMRNAMPYTFLGQADYISHESSRPMSIIWKLQMPIPAKYIAKTNKLDAV